MAEARQAVAYQFSTAPDGTNVQTSHQALTEIYLSGVRTWKKRILRLKVTARHRFPSHRWLKVKVWLCAKCSLGYLHSFVCRYVLVVNRQNSI